jgi:hypothetical protein
MLEMAFMFAFADGLDQLFRMQSFKQFQNIGLAGLGLDVVFLLQAQANIANAHRLYDQLPDPRPNFVEAVAKAFLHMQRNDLTADLGLDNGSAALHARFQR